MDEKGFLIGLINKMLRIFSRQQWEEGKLFGAGQDGNRSWITLLACICQDLQPLPPMLIYQGQEGNFKIPSLMISIQDGGGILRNFTSEVLSYENKDLRRAVFLEKRKRKRQTPLKNYLLDPEDA